MSTGVCDYLTFRPVRAKEHHSSGLNEMTKLLCFKLLVIKEFICIFFFGVCYTFYIIREVFHCGCYLFHQKKTFFFFFRYDTSSETLKNVGEYLYN